MKRTDNFFVIHNFNTVPTHLLDYCADYVIYDASDDASVRKALRGLDCVRVSNTGHNISSYFKYIIDHYDALPPFVAFLKGNIIGRHLSPEFFKRVYDNKYYTFLYEDREIRGRIKKDVFFLSKENEYLEINNSWYAGTGHPTRYFNSFNRLLKFVYADPLIPEYCCFSPGACYIVSSAQLRKNSRQFYENLQKIISYTEGPLFPSEAHQVERMLHIIYTSNYVVNDWMNDGETFDFALANRVEETDPPLRNYGLAYRALRKAISVQTRILHMIDR